MGTKGLGLEAQLSKGLGLLSLVGEIMLPKITPLCQEVGSIKPILQIGKLRSEMMCLST